ncbi:MAG: ATP-grasp domain-containing protein [Candidatus Coproplasma sp.]
MLKNYEIAVIFGGVSSENEVSVITGTMVSNVLKKGGKSVLPVYIDHGGNMLAGDCLADVTLFRQREILSAKGVFLCAMAQGGFVLFKGGKPKKFVGVGCVINCCHGGCAEGGAVAGTALLNKIPFASASLFESAAFMDKYYTKLVLKSLRVNVAKYAYSRDIDGAIKKAQAVGYPLIVKPATLGSSIGVVKVDDEKQLKAALETAFELDNGILLEEYFTERRELNCAAYYSGGEVVVSPCEEVYSASEILTYDDKYSGGGNRKFPVDGACEKAVQLITKRVYEALGMRGVVRFDFIAAKGKVYLSEVNTVPGSLSQYLLSKDYKDFYKVLCGIIEQAKKDFARLRGKRIISTGILNNIRSNACKLK